MATQTVNDHGNSSSNTNYIVMSNYNDDNSKIKEDIHNINEMGEYLNSEENSSNNNDTNSSSYRNNNNNSNIN